MSTFAAELVRVKLHDTARMQADASTEVLEVRLHMQACTVSASNTTPLKHQ